MGHLHRDICHPVEGAWAELFDQGGGFFQDLVIELGGAVLIFLEDLQEEVAYLGCVVGGLAGIDQDLLEFVIHAEVFEPSEHRKNVCGGGDKCRKDALLQVKKEGPQLRASPLYVSLTKVSKQYQNISNSEATVFHRVNEIFSTHLSTLLISAMRVGVAQRIERLHD